MYGLMSIVGIYDYKTVFYVEYFCFPVGYYFGVTAPPDLFIITE